MEAPLRLLIIEDSEDDAELVRRALSAAGHELSMHRVESAAALVEALDRQEWDLVIADHSLPGFGGLEALEIFKQRALDVPFLILSGKIGEEQAVAAMRAGASDYIMKDRMGRLPAAVEHELDEARVRRAQRELIERQRASELEIARMARQDPTSGLPNRGALQEHFEQRLVSARETLSSFALLCVGLDRFGSINTILGLDVGDGLLKEAGRRLSTVLSEGDALGCLGGPHFCILLHEAGATRAREVSAAITAVLEESILVADLPVQLEATIGIALSPGHGESFSELLRCARIAMMEARRSGSVRLVYSPRQDGIDPQGLALLGGLRQAITGSQLFLEFQPLVDLQAGRTVGVEALVRWKHPRLGIVPPGRFIPLAESSGLIRPLSHWVMAQGMAHWRSWQRQGIDLGIAVNLSARNLSDPGLLEGLHDLMDTWGVTPGALEIEITESALMADPERALATLRRMHAWGIRLAIDDFGTGFSSFSYLSKLPVDKIKIDRSFVAGLATSERDAAVVRAMIDLGHTLGMKVVAEGVEDDVTCDLLAAFDCDLVQGYLVSKPLGNEDLVRWLAASRWGSAAARGELADGAHVSQPSAPLPSVLASAPSQDAIQNSPGSS